MEDNYNEEFDNFFARDLKQAGKGASPDSREWSALSARLDAATIHAPWYLLLLWLLLPLLLAGNIWTLLNWRTLHNEVTLLKQQATLPPANQLPITTTTLQEHQTTIIHDTIYRTVVITRQVINKTEVGENVSGKQAFQNKISNLPPTLRSTNFLISSKDENDKKISSKNIDNQLIIGNSVLNSDTPIVSSSTLTDNESNTVKSSTDSLNQTAATTLTTVPAAIATVESKADSVLETSAPPRSVIDSLLETPAPIIKRHHDPLRWRVGMGLGLVAANDVSALRLAEHFSASVQGELLFGQHWAVVPGLFYTSYEYRITKPYDPRLSLIAPPPPSPEYEFRHFEGRMQQLLPSVTLRYRFRPDKICSFYAGAGYAAQINLANLANCEYTEHGTGQEFFYEVPVNASNRLSMGISQAGVEMRLNNHWRIFGDANGMFDLGRAPKPSPILIAELGLKWGFK